MASTTRMQLDQSEVTHSGKQLKMKLENERRPIVNKNLIDARIDLLEMGVKFGGFEAFKEDADQAVLQAARVLVEIDKVENSRQCKALFKFAKENPNDEDVLALKGMVK